MHVIVPPLWSPPDPAYAQFATGITAEQLQSCADLPDVRWHIVDDEDHLSLRTVPTAPEKLIDFVRAIDPDYTFCRGADVWTPNAFPGQVRFLMEGEFPPLPPTVVPGGARHWRTPARACRRIVMLGPRLYDHGIVPPLDTDQRASLLQQVAPAWHALCNWRSGQGGSREAYLAQVGLPTDRRILAVPLILDGPHSFFGELHSLEPSNLVLVEKLLSQLDQDFILALTAHPIQQAFGGATVDRIAALDPDRIRIVRAPGPLGNATLSLIQHCDGTIITDSKVFPEAPSLGKPMLRVSRYASGAWMNVYDELALMQSDIRAGTARTAAPEETMLWYAFHYANDAFAANDPELMLADLIDRIERPLNPARWEANLSRYLDEKYGAFLAAVG